MLSPQAAREKTHSLRIRICAATTIDRTMSAFVVKAMEHLASNGYDVTLACAMDDEFRRRHEPRFQCVNLPMARGNDLIGGLRTTWRLWRLFRRERYDVVQYATPNASMYCALAAWAARIPARVYCQWGLRYAGFQGWRRALYRWLEKSVCRLSTHIRPASRKNLLFAVGEGLYPESRAAVVGDGGTIGVDLSVFDVDRREVWRREIRAKMGLGDTLVFGFVGSIRRDKGAAELIHAFRQFLEGGQVADLLLLGAVFPGDPIDPALWDWALASPRVHYCGRVPDAYRYLAAMDVLVHPSYREGFSMVIQEAAAMALPVITTDIPGPSEVIEPGLTGLLVPARDAAALASAMVALSADVPLRQSMGNAGLERTRQLFSRSRMLAATLDDRNHILEETR